MKIKELIEKLKKYDGEKDVIIRFAIDEEDEIGYILEPRIVGMYFDEVAIYSEYTATEEECAFIGQIDLKKAYKKMLNEED